MSVGDCTTGKPRMILDIAKADPPRFDLDAARRRQKGKRSLSDLI
jgi:hypothetical protein